MDITIFMTGLILSFARVSSFLFFVPFLRVSYIPNSLKVVLSFSLSVYAADKMSGIELNSTMHFVALLISQIMIGLTLAFFVEMFFQIAKMAGSLMDFDMGLSMAEMVDPSNGKRITVMSNLFNILFIVVFISSGGINMLITNIMYSFKFTDPSFFLGKASFIDLLLVVFLYMMTGAIQIALPFMATIFVVNFIFLIIGRASPQINIFANMFIVKIALGLIYFLIAVPLMSEVFMQINDVITERLFEILDVLFKK